MILLKDKTRLTMCENKLYLLEEQFVEISKLLEKSDPAPSEPQSVTELLEEDLKLAIVELGKMLKKQQDSSTVYLPIQDQINASRILAYLKIIETLHKLLYEPVGENT